MQTTSTRKSIATPMMLSDDALATVSGAKCHHHHHPKFPWGTSVDQSNSVGPIIIFAPNNSGTIDVTVNQSNTNG